MWYQFQDFPMIFQPFETYYVKIIVWIFNIFHILPNILVYTSDLHAKLCQKLRIRLRRPLSLLMMDLHQMLYRFHVIESIDAHMSHLGGTHIGYCLIVFWESKYSNRELKIIFSKTLHKLAMTILVHNY